MAKNMLLSTVLCALIVLHSTTAKTQWIRCFDDSCPIKNIKFGNSVRSTVGEGPIYTESCSYAYINDDVFAFTLTVPKANRFSNGIGWTKDEFGGLRVLFTCGNLLTPTGYIIPKINGTSIYLDGEKLCSWSIKINNLTFPYELIDPAQYYLSENTYQIFYNLNQTVPVAAANFSQLPESVESFVEGYQFKAVGSEKYLLIARAANETVDFLLKVNEEAPRLVEVNLNSELSVGVECNFKKKTFESFIKPFGVKFSLWDKVKEYEIDEDECRWSLPDSWETIYGSVELKHTPYELEIIENNRFVYFNEDNFSVLKALASASASASSALIITKSLLITMLLFLFLDHDL